jgi:hypothetical protein
MIAAAMHPASQFDFFPDLGLTDVTAIMCSHG